jgi:ParB family transcriptional regulator, chromosome partitioning protein
VNTEPNTATRGEVPLGVIAESTLNPRKQFDPKELEGLTASIAQNGVLQPVLLRPLPEIKNGLLYETVCGSRRIAASKLAKKETITAVVRTMTDAEALEAMMIENLQRESVHYLDEALGFQSLIDKGHSAEDISIKVGKPLTYVIGRLSLSRLIKPYQKPALAGAIPVSVARALARLTPQIQQAYFDDNCGKNGEREPYHLPVLQDWLDRHVYLDLAKAPFNTQDAELVPEAGSCHFCPKRTGANPMLFEEFSKQQNVCTDPPCYESKCEALVKIRLTETPGAVKVAAERYMSTAQEKEADKSKVLRPFGYDNKEKGYHVSSKDACEHTVPAVIAMGSPDRVGQTAYVCTSLKCQVHTGEGSRRIKHPNATPGKMDPERAKAVEELWQRRTGFACRDVVHQNIRVAQEKLAATAKENHTVPIEALRIAVLAACKAMRPQKEGTDYLNSFWLKKKPDSVGWGGEHILPLIEKADQSTCLRLLLDFAIADDVANKFNTHTSLNKTLTNAYGIDVEKVIKPTLDVWLAKKKASYDKRKARLAHEKEKVKKGELEKDPSPTAKVINGGEYRVPQEFLELAAEMNSCGDEYIQKGKLRGIVQFAKLPWACVGSMGTGKDGTLSADLVRLHSQASWTGTVRAYDTERRGYDGILVKHKGEEHVLGDTRITLKPRKSKATPAKIAKDSPAAKAVHGLHTGKGKLKVGPDQTISLAEIESATVRALSDGQYCRFCRCTETSACELLDGEPCSWIEKPKKVRGKKDAWKPGVCSNPKCVLALQQEKKAAKKEAKG